MCGGHDGSVVVSSCEVYSFARGNWSPLQADMPDALYHAAGVFSGRHMFIIGGYTGSAIVASVWRLDTLNGEWEYVTPLDQRRHGAKALVTRRRNLKNQDEDQTTRPTHLILVCGGHDGSSYLSSCEQHDVEGYTWTPFPPMVKERYEFGLVEWQGTLYAIGGQGDGGTDLDSIEMFDEEEGAWSIIEAKLPAPRSHFAAVVF